ncbi:MAG: penicillin acylase family protein [Acidobacteria bacterium]|nr:penicillin acylase family protein [Acidobacteriota bacterium]
MRRALLFLALFNLLACERAPAPESVSSLLEQAKSRLSKVEGETALPGLEAPVEILRDKWGVAHIYAQNQHDLFFAQGYVAAQDRLYQIEIWRRTGAGELAEVFGPDYIDRDRIARLVRYRGDMEAEWASYSPDSKQIAEAFTSGINAYVDENRDNLPIEFELLGFEPARWEPEDVLLRVAGLLMVRNVSQEIARAEMIAKLGVDKTDRFFPTDPKVKIEPDPDLDLNGLDERVIAAYRRAVSIPKLDEQTQGSNNWVVSGKLSQTGKPLLASDPHRPVILPSLRYLVHLNAPGWNVIGSGEPALPGVAIGHNERAGWGFTIVQFDLADLFVEKLNPENPKQYRYGDEWLEMEVEQATVQVRGAEPAEVELELTRHGPVIWKDPDGGRAVSLRWAGQEPGTAGYLGSLAVDRIANWDDFVQAMSAWKVPSENMVYADVDGDIGWIPSGLMPIRQKGRGLLPEPGWKPEYGWNGFRAIAELPRLHNPAQGYIATANHNILPKDYPHDLGFDWSAPYRFQRIDEALGHGGPFGISDFERLQHDEGSIPARQIVDMLRAANVNKPPEAVALLSDWDFVVDKDSAAAALFEVWLPRLHNEYVASQAPPSEQALIAANLQTPTLIAGLGELVDSQRALVLGESLKDAWAETSGLLGDDPGKWRWGALHHILFEHPLANTEARREAFNLGPVERGGDSMTPNATGGPKFSQATGASYRHILDFADWDRSVFTSTPGQSGQPGSPHYGDLLPKWANHEYSPLVYSRKAVEDATEHRLTLKPAP